MNTNTKKTKIIIIIAMLCLFLGMVVYFQNNPTVIKNGLSKFNLIPKPEHFTELYFEDFTTLPASVSAGQVLNMTFTIHNVEGKDMVYPYAVYFEYPNGETVSIKQGSINIVNNDIKSVNVLYAFLNSNVKGKIVVKLTNLNQQIDFLLPNQN